MVEQISHSKINRCVFIGFRGTGKSTIGKRLVKLLSWRYISTDELVEKAAGMTIGAFVGKKGWQEFRRMESEQIISLQDASDAVIDCGGGVVENQANMKILSLNSRVIWVDAKMLDIRNRLANHQDRPLLSETDLNSDLSANYRRRLPLYQKYAEFRVNSSEHSVEEICREILKQIS
jgi:shikimate kinase